MESPGYFNTTHLNGKELKQAIQAAEGQEAKIMAFFEGRPHGNYTPWEVQDFIGLVNTPITSIRRAITNLTDAGKLKKTTVQRPGPYRNVAYAWELAR